MVPRTTFAAAVPLPWGLLVGVLVGLLWAAGRLLNRLWWQPRRLERVLSSQGFRGTSYRFLTGDLKDFARLNQEAWSRPLPLRCHDIAPRAIPFLYNNMREHGKTSLSWFGPIPKVTIADPELAKDVLSSKFGHFEKPRFPALFKLLLLPTENNRKMCRINKEIGTILRDLIEKRIQAIKEGESTRHDLLGLLLESNMRETDGTGKSGMAMTIEDIIGECKLFYFAGMETMSVLLTWTMVVLSMHPEWQDRAREEVTMILYEVLRLYPPGNKISRKTYKEVELGGIVYPAGVIVEMSVLMIHHDPDIWGSDVHEFKPDRFSEGICKASKGHAAFLPFGWGPRICIGQNFALLEAKIALCMILQRFEFELAPSYTHVPHIVVAMHPMHGAQVKLRVI
ncbi:hypothetical protein HU200_047462 [Digitaria exilis]|uniref:Cytochrome P450 n=1 Tax=Digitaria exilis TaxID=1010633 RepID=A0A835AX66_9POAL|nr:hypothetical protein HU200_047462 [Digitaria exilis]